MTSLTRFLMLAIVGGCESRPQAANKWPNSHATPLHEKLLPSREARAAKVLALSFFLVDLDTAVSV